MASLISKGRKPRFELHLKIYDLNNVPLVSGGSLVKWHLSHSIHAEHRGRSHKCPILNHKVDYNYSKIVGHIRISVDKNNNLSECPIEFEVLQEFLTGGRDEKISLGTVRLNLSEYVGESDGRARENATAARRSRDGNSFDKGHSRKRSSNLGGIHGSSSGNGGGAGSASNSISSRPASSSGTTAAEEPEAEEGIVRRYLMQDSKINSTLKIGILMVQVDGEKNFVAPPLRTAPVFGGIAGIMAGEQVEQDDAGQLPTIAKSRDHAEVQDMYRKSLAASWSRQPGELSADQCIEDIFAGGDGWSASSSNTSSSQQTPRRHPSQTSDHSASSSSGGNDRSGARGRSDRGGGFDGSFDASDDGEVSGSGMGGGGGGDTLRPSDYRKLQRNQVPSSSRSQHHGSSIMRAFSPHRRHQKRGSNASDKSVSTVTGRGLGTSTSSSNLPSLTPGLSISTSGSSQSRSPSRYGQNESAASSKDDLLSTTRSRSESLTSLAPTMGSGSSGRGAGRDGAYTRAREVDEFDVRDDMVAWSLPGEVR